MNTAAIGEWTSEHKPVVIGGAAGLVLLLLYLRHRAKATGQSTAGQSGVTGATTDTGSYTVPVDSGTVDTGSSSGPDNTDLLNAITGLTTTIQNLDPATGATNNGTDNAGGDPVHLHGTPIFAKPQPVHTAKKKTPVVHRTPLRHPAPVKKTAAKKPPRLRNPRRPSTTPAKTATKHRPVTHPVLLKS